MSGVEPGGTPGLLVGRVMDRCLQLHGGYGAMREYAVGRAFVDARIQTIHGGTTAITKDLIGRDLARSVVRN